MCDSAEENPMSTTIWLLLGVGVAALLAYVLLPQRYSTAILRAPLSLLGGIVGWGLAALGIAIALVIAAHVAQIFLPP